MRESYTQNSVHVAARRAAVSFGDGNRGDARPRRRARISNGSYREELRNERARICRGNLTLQDEAPLSHDGEYLSWVRNRARNRVTGGARAARLSVHRYRRRHRMLLHHPVGRMEPDEELLHDVGVRQWRSSARGPAVAVLAASFRIERRCHMPHHREH